MPNSEYDAIPKSGGLKLKKIDHTIKKKKKKKEERSEVSGSTQCQSEEQQLDIDEAIEAKIRERNPLRSKTKAELKCLQMQEKMVRKQLVAQSMKVTGQDKLREKRVMDKASKTHKMRVEEFNRHLDNLTEHFDIPKVSWTK